MRTPNEAVDPAMLRQSVARVRERVHEAAAVSGRAGSDVRLLAAVKYVDAAACAAFVGAGVVDLAESRLDALEAKQEASVGVATVADDARWHYIGRLQSRQAPRVAARVDMIHTLSSTSAAARLAAQDARPQLLVQVNIDDDPSKDGLAPAEVERFLLDLPDELHVCGFMAMPAFATDPEASRPAFVALRALRDRLAPCVAGRHELAALSIGTSQDFVVAVEEGATHVRLGRILYGSGE